MNSSSSAVRGIQTIRFRLLGASGSESTSSDIEEKLQSTYYYGSRRLGTERARDAQVIDSAATLLI
jgi:hypothetical protein